MMRLLTGDCRDILRTLPAESVHCCVTSPPYFGLRDYGNAGQIGLERTPDEYVAAMVDVFREVKRVLRKDGTCWLNLGDSYAQNEIRHRNKESVSSGLQTSAGKWSAGVAQTGRKLQHNVKPKDLIGIPWAVAFALRADGWWLRQDIIWSKPNPMPESVTDRCTKAHEYLFLLTKSARYYYDAETISEAVTDSTVARMSQPLLDQQNGSYRAPGKTNGPMKAVPPRFGGSKYGDNDTEENRTKSGNDYEIKDGKRNRRSVWTVATQPYSGSHFATFPPALIEPCIKAGTSEKGCCAACGAPWGRQIARQASTPGRSNASLADPSQMRNDGNRCGGFVDHAAITTGWSPSCRCDAAIVPCTVLDPFSGAGTTGLVADRLGRNAILIELNPEYAAMTGNRIHADAGMFATVVAE